MTNVPKYKVVTLLHGLEMMSTGNRVSSRPT